ncbi:hypothetical protein LINPERHAP1_LOCUS19150 [Linum perenne]
MMRQISTGLSLKDPGWLATIMLYLKNGYQTLSLASLS